MLRRAAFLVVLAVILGACTTTPKGAPTVVQAPQAEPVTPTDPATPPGLPQGRPLGACTGTAPVVPITQDGAEPVVEMGQWFVEEEQSLLVAYATRKDPRISPVDPVVTEVTADKVRLLLRFWGWGEMKAVESLLRVEGAKASCRWGEDGLLAVELSGVKQDAWVLGIPVLDHTKSNQPREAYAVHFRRSDLPRVTVTGPNGKTVPVRANLEPLMLPAGPIALTYRFDRPMDRAKVEERLREGTVRLSRGFDDLYREYNTTPAAVAFTWESDRALTVRVDGSSGGRYRLPVGGMADTTGKQTVGFEVEVDTLSVPVGYLNSEGKLTRVDTLPDFIEWSFTPEVAPDGKLMLLHESVMTEFAPEYRPWLYFPAEKRLVRMPDKYYSGNTYQARLLPGGKGLAVADSDKLTLYDTTGKRRVVWEKRGLIHGMAVAPHSGKVALFVHGLGDEVRLFVVDPAGGAPVDVGVVDRTELKPSHSEVSKHKRIHAHWSPDESEIAFGWMEYDSKGRTDYVTARFNVKERRMVGTEHWLQLGGWAPDGKHLVGYRYAQDSPEKATLLWAPPGKETWRTDGIWRWEAGDFLWQSKPVQWRGREGNPQAGPEGWQAFGYTSGRLWVVQPPGGDR